MGKKPAQLVKFEPTPKEGKKAAIYIRVSSNEFRLTRKEAKELRASTKATSNPLLPQNEALEDKVRESVATQREDAITYCKQQTPPWAYEIYEDNELSGTLGSDERPKLARLLKDVDAGIIHTVLVRDIKRLARSGRILKDIVATHLLPNGVELHGLTDGTRISTPNARFFTSILAEVAELEVNYTREHSMRNREQAALDGTLAHCPCTYGYQSTGKRSVGIVPKEAKWVRVIFHEYAINKRSCQDIADKLTAQKAPTRWGSGFWSSARVYAILHNPRYIGRINYRGHTMLENHVFKPIIEMKVWDKAQAELKRRSIIGPRTQNSPHLLTGLLKCPYCIERQKKDPNVKPNMFSMIAGKTLRYYDCQTRHRKGARSCKGVRVNAEVIETFIERFIGWLSARDFFEFISDQPDEKNLVAQRIEVLKSSINKQQQRLSLLAKKLAKGILTAETVGEAETILRKDIKSNTAELERAEIDLLEVSKAEQLDAVDKLKQWKSLTIQQKRTALKKVIAEMVMYPDRLLITFIARPNSPITVPYKRFDPKRKKPRFPNVLDGSLEVSQDEQLRILVGQEFSTPEGKSLKTRIDPVPTMFPAGQEFVTIDGKPFKSHIEPVPITKKVPSDKKVWQDMNNHPDKLDDD